MTTNNGRISELDGLRGLAILLVVGFHYFSARPDLLPYGNTFAGFPLFKYGFLGVQLFFMISGYVIFMSLDASRGIGDFARRRWLRLFPAMLIATIGVLLTAPLLAERPMGMPRIQDIIPGLTFVEARWYRALLGVDIRDLEGAFWSLYVEVRFYVMASVLYFMVGRRAMVGTLAGLVLVTSVAKLLVFRLGFSGATGDAVVYALSEVLIGQHLAWFMVGIVTYMRARGELGRSGYVAVLAAAGFSLLTMRADKTQLAIAAVLVSLFLIVMWFRKMKAVFNWRLFAYVGFISYPFYLFHENAGIALIIKLGKFTPMPGILLPVIVFIAMALIAQFIATVLEPRLHGLLRRAIAPRVPDLATNG